MWLRVTYFFLKREKKSCCLDFSNNEIGKCLFKCKIIFPTEFGQFGSFWYTFLNSVQQNQLQKINVFLAARYIFIHHVFLFPAIKNKNTRFAIFDLIVLVALQLYNAHTNIRIFELKSRGFYERYPNCLSVKSILNTL